jgi:hypothetical protein
MLLPGIYQERRMKRADHGTKLQGTPKHEKPSEPAAQTGKNPKDAREDDAKLAENRKDLGVEPDHKTEDMEEANRGTFP